MLDIIWRIALLISTLPFRLRSSIVSTPLVTHFNYTHTKDAYDPQAHYEHLHGYLQLTDLYLEHQLGDTAFTLSRIHHRRNIITRLQVGEWFRIIFDNRGPHQLQVGYAVLNRIVDWQQTQVIIEVVASMGGWARAEYVQIAIAYVDIDIHYRYRNYPTSPSDTHVNDLRIPIPDHYTLPHRLIATSRQPPEAQQLPRLPQLPTSVNSAVPYRLLQNTVPHLSPSRRPIQSTTSPFVSWFSPRTPLPPVEIIVTTTTTVTED